MAQSSSYNGTENGETTLVKSDEVQQLATILEQKQPQHVADDESEIIVTTMKPSPRRIIDTIIHSLIPTKPPSPEYEIASGDMIEIDIPIIGSEFITRRNQDEEANHSKVDVTDDHSKDIKTVRDVQPLTLRNADDFQMSTAKSENVEKMTAEASATSPTIVRNVENKIPAFVDGEGRIFTIKKPSKLTFTGNRLLPLTVKIYVDKVDEKKSCKTKTSCNQVNFAGSGKAKVAQQQQRDHDIDLQFYTEYSDEDLVFNDYQSSNGLRSRNAKRAAMPGDESMKSLTPAPRIPFIPGLPVLKKPAIFERMENESSMERAERINKDLDSVMKFVAVWAHVDKFISERARSAIRKLAYLTHEGGGDYDDNLSILGSPKRKLSKMSDLDDPFTWLAPRQRKSAFRRTRNSGLKVVKMIVNFSQAFLDLADVWRLFK